MDRVRGAAIAVVVVLVLARAVAGTVAPAAAATTAVSYQPPVDAPIIDHFRPPPHPWAAGNRGIDYATAAGDRVHAAASGRVVFAGPVGGTRHVTLLHADGLRTSYSFLSSTLVVLDHEVAAGDPIGVASGPLHFGVRLGDDYLDPELLFAGHVPTPRLLPVEPPFGGPGSERRALWTVVVDAVGRGWSSVSRQAAPWLHYRQALDPAGRVVATLVGVVRRRRAQRACTPAEQPVTVPQGDRVVVLVAGLGSSSDDGAIDELNVEALGYQPENVVRFSYGGGQVTPGSADDERWGRAFPDLAHSEYDAAEVEGDLRRAGGRLLELLVALSVEAPGVPIDVIAHSQGGVVTRLALEGGVEAGGLPTALEHVITLATPHGGADLATAAVAIGADPEGAIGLSALVAAGRRVGIDFDPTAASVAQLAETSSVIGQLAGGVPPDGIIASSIAARGDLVVPVPRTDWPGARRAVVSVDGTNDHSTLPGSPAAAREITLALAGEDPGCESLADTIADQVTGEAVSWAEDLVGADLALAARTVR
jgi:hypothetical protein